MREHIRLALSSPGPVESDWQTDTYGTERRQRIRSYNTQLTIGDDVMGESHFAGGVRPSVAETPAAAVIRDDRSPRWHENRADNDAGGRVDRPGERVIWSPFRLLRRRRS